MLEDILVVQVAKEIELHSNLEHPALLALYAAFEDGEGIHLAQELATGGDLYHVLASSGGNMKEGAVSSLVVRPLLDALAYLHNQVGIFLHRLSSLYA